MDASDRRWLVKHSSIEFGEEWWFLDEVDNACDWERIISVDSLHFLKNMHRAKFVKRYSSQEELDIEFDLRYRDSAKLKLLR